MVLSPKISDHLQIWGYEENAGPHWWSLIFKSNGSLEIAARG